MIQEKQRGFTLIELLAVIVILAILALIAIPIVISIINDSRENSHKRSIENYGRSVENAIAQYQEKNDVNDLPMYISAYNVKTSGAKVLCDDGIRWISGDNGIKLINCRVVDSKGVQKSKYSYTYKNRKATKSGEEDDDEEDQETAVQYLLSKANNSSITYYSSGSPESHQMYTFSHPATEQIEALTDYRYIGSDPNNYVEFNGETWRIVGVFTVEDENGNKEQRIKLYKKSSVTVTYWSSNQINEWSTSYINTYLNGDYYNNQLIKNDAKSMIATSKFYLGAGVYYSGINWGTASDMYVWERGTRRYNSNRKINWVGKVGLIYPSDITYTYAYGIDRICHENAYDCYIYNNGNPLLGWIYNGSGQWTISPNSHNSYDSFAFYSVGQIRRCNSTTHSEIHPSVYLKSSVRIIGGDGSSNSPYKLEL